MREKKDYGYVGMMVKKSQINKSGIILKTFETPGNVIGFTSEVHQEFAFIVGWSDTKIYKIKSDRVVTVTLFVILSVHVLEASESTLTTIWSWEN